MVKEINAAKWGQKRTPGDQEHEVYKKVNIKSKSEQASFEACRNLAKGKEMGQAFQICHNCCFCGDLKKNKFFFF